MREMSQGNWVGKKGVDLAIGVGRPGLIQVVGFRQNGIWLGIWDIGLRIGVGPK